MRAELSLLLHRAEECKAGLSKANLERQHQLLNNCGQVVSLWSRVDGLKQRLQAAEEPSAYIAPPTNGQESQSQPEIVTVTTGCRTSKRTSVAPL
jgi:hypothetical protein